MVILTMNWLNNLIYGFIVCACMCANESISHEIKIYIFRKLRLKCLNDFSRVYSTNKSKKFL